MLPVVSLLVLVLTLRAVATTPYEVALLTGLCINIVTLTGLNLIAGYAGQLALGHAAFVGLGAYSAVFATEDWGLAPGMAVPAAIVLGAVLAVLVGAPSLRLRGLYFAVATLAIGVIFQYLVLQGGASTGGPDGRGLSRRLVFGPIALDTPESLFVGALAVAALVLLLSQFLVSTWAGWGVRAARSSEPAAAAAGVPVFASRVVLFGIAGALGGLAGALLAFNQMYVSPSSFGFFASVDLFVVLFLGGLGTAGGPIVGAVILYVFDRYLTAYPDARPFVLGSIFLLALRFFPNGLVGTLSGFLQERRASRQTPRDPAVEAATEVREQREVAHR